LAQKFKIQDIQIEIFVKNTKLGQNLMIWPKIKHLVKNRKFGQKLKICQKLKIGSKLDDLVKN